MKWVIDTNVIVSALRSKNGASFALISSLPRNDLEPVLSTPLYQEYREQLLKSEYIEQYGQESLESFIAYLCSISSHYSIYFSWRPTLRDADDEMVLELAIASGAEGIVTHNIKDFRKNNVVKAFGIDILTPSELLLKLRNQP